MWLLYICLKREIQGCHLMLGPPGAPSCSPSSAPAPLVGTLWSLGTWDTLLLVHSRQWHTLQLVAGGRVQGVEAPFSGWGKISVLVPKGACLKGAALQGAVGQALPRSDQRTCSRSPSTPGLRTSHHVAAHLWPTGGTPTRKLWSWEGAYASP